MGQYGNYAGYLFCQNFRGFSVIDARVELQKPLQKGEVVAAQGPKAFKGRVSRKTAAGAIEILGLPSFVEKVLQPLDYRTCLRRLEKTILGSGYLH